MARDINVFTVTGRLVRDAEVSYSKAGKAVCTFSAAYTRRVPKGDQWEDKSCFIDVVIFGKTAENLHKYLVKGKQVLLSGELDFDKWEDKETGKPRSKHKLVGPQVQLLGGSKDGGIQQQETGVNEPAPAGADPAPGVDFEDDIPF